MVPVAKIGGHLVSMPGVGVVDVSETIKVELAPSRCNFAPAHRATLTVPSTISPAVGLVYPTAKLGITELRLAAHKPPACIVLCEDIQSYRPLPPPSSPRDSDGSGSGMHNSGTELVTEMHALAGRQGDPFAET